MIGKFSSNDYPVIPIMRRKHIWIQQSTLWRVDLAASRCALNQITAIQAQHSGFQAWIWTDMSPQETRASDMLREYLPMNSKELASCRAVSSWPPEKFDHPTVNRKRTRTTFPCFWGGGYHSFRRIDLFDPDSDGTEDIKAGSNSGLKSSSPVHSLLSNLFLRSCCQSRLPHSSTTPHKYVQTVKGRQVPGPTYLWWLCD